MASGYGLADMHQAMEHTEVIKVSDGLYKYINKAYEKVSSKMYDYKCDVKLRIGDQNFRAHRHVLSDASDYFDAMFSHNMKEKEQDVIEFHEISTQGFTCMLEYFYHGHISLHVDNIEDVLEASRFFHIDWLIQICCDFLVEHLSLENYHTVLELADKYYLGDFRHKIFCNIGQNFCLFADQGKLMHLSEDLFFQLLNGDYYIGASEFIIFQTLERWLDHDHEGREKAKEEMLKLIRFPLFSSKELNSINPELLENEVILSMVEEAKKYQENPSAQCLLTSKATEARGAQDAIVLISAVDDIHQIQYKIPSDLGYFSEEINSSFLESLFEFTSSAVLGNFLFVAGGYERQKWCSTSLFYRYNPRDRSWAQLASMNHPRVSFALCSAYNGLYAVAGIEHVIQDGRDHENILSSVEFYDPNLGIWQEKTPLISGCFSIAAACVDQTLYVSGGITDDTEDNIPVGYLRALHAKEDTWVLKTPMFTERQGHAMISHAQRLYVYGGYTSGEDSMSFSSCFATETFDIETNQWTQLENVDSEIGHIHPTVTILNDLIYVLGGKSEERMLMTFDPDSENLLDSEFCGLHVQRLGTLKVAFPIDLQCQAAF